MSIARVFVTRMGARAAIVQAGGIVGLALGVLWLVAMAAFLAVAGLILRGLMEESGSGRGDAVALRRLVE